MSVTHCGSGAVLGIDPKTKTGILIPLTCKSWLCDSCRKVKIRNWIKVAQAGRPERMITLTCDPKLHVNPYTALRTMAKAFTKLAERIRKKFGEFEYIKVWELHKTGWPHLHLMQRGSFIPQRWLSSQWSRLKIGKIVDIRKVTNQKTTATYMTKYMGKSVADLASLWSGVRVISKSNGWVIPEVQAKIQEQREEYVWRMIKADYWQIASDLATRGVTYTRFSQWSSIVILDFAPADMAASISPGESLPWEWMKETLESEQPP